jgi:hypothetical protein
MNKITVKIGLDAFVYERSRGQTRPPLRVVSVVVADDCSAILSIVNVRKDVSA